MAVPGLYTTVKNTSGSARVFGFLGPHGKRLAANETYTVPGDLVATLGNSGRGGQRQFKALEKALETNKIDILSSPAVYLLDADDNSVDQLRVNDDTLGTVTPPTGWT
jgi:hypothetical protein